MQERFPPEQCSELRMRPSEEILYASIVADEGS